MKVFLFEKWKSEWNSKVGSFLEVEEREEWIQYGDEVGLVWLWF